jgi:hypothetical protein
MSAAVFGRLAVDLEAGSGLPCGSCGLPHVAFDDPGPASETCSCCPPCARRLVDGVVAELIQLFPDLVPPSTRMISAAMLEAVIERMLKEIARLDHDEEAHASRSSRSAPECDRS